MTRNTIFHVTTTIIISFAATYAQSPPPGRYAAVNGLTMYYEIHGNGTPLVLIHGGGSTIETSFGRILPDLAEEFQVIAVELQAHGHTSDRDAPESFEQDADDVAELLHQLKIPRASFLGFSNGGSTAMQIAIRHPEIVDRLILASAVYRLDGMMPGFFDMMKNATLADMPQTLKSAFLNINPDTAKLTAMFQKDRNRMLHFTDWSDSTVASIKAPALIINGDRDVVQAAHAAAMAKIISGSRLLILPATHGSYIGVAETSAPDSTVIHFTVDVMKKFLRGEY